MAALAGRLLTCYRKIEFLIKHAGNVKNKAQALMIPQQIQDLASYPKFRRRSSAQNGHLSSLHA